MTTTTKQITLTDTTWEDETEETQARVRALCTHLDCDPEDLAQDYSETSFEHEPHTVRDGTSPKKAQQLVDTLKEALHNAGMEEFTRSELHRDSERNSALAAIDAEIAASPDSADLQTQREEIQNQLTYGTVKGILSTHNPESLKIGLHDVLNTLYFVSPETDGPGTHAEDHRDSIREAFDGVDVIDRTKPRKTNNGEYEVLTDSEADDAWDDSLESYLDDCVEGSDGPYFDREAWKRDAKMDGRGHSLNHYDGSEATAEDLESEETYYIYRTN